MINTRIECVGDNFIIQSDGAIECKVSLAFNVGMADTTTICVIDEIQREENRNQLDFSMIIYMVKLGDTLWNIAKQFKTTVDSIMELNELVDGKLKVGDKLYIPRHRNNQMEISA